MNVGTHTARVNRLARHLLAGVGVAACALPAHAMLITATFDPSYGAADQATVFSAISMFESMISTNVTVNINFGLTSGLGSSSQYIYGTNYNSVYSALSANATSAADISSVAHLPSSGTGTVYFTHAQCAALGFGCGAPAGGVDGSIGINLGLVDSNRADGIAAGQYDMLAVVEHEIDEILGIGGGGSFLGIGYFGVEDLFRYAAPGVTTTNTTTANSYFSVDGGVTSLAYFNQTTSGDFGDWAGAAVPAVQDAYGTPGVIVNYGSAEKTALDVIGWTLSSTTASVPEPASVLLVLPALLALGFSRRSRHAAS